MRVGDSRPANRYRRRIGNHTEDGMTAIKALHAAPVDVRTAALALLDQVSAPLTDRQLVAAFRGHGIGWIEARKMARALRRLDIIAITPRTA
jgi:hypothetical protein